MGYGQYFRVGETVFFGAEQKASIQYQIVKNPHPSKINSGGSPPKRAGEGRGLDSTPLGGHLPVHRSKRRDEACCNAVSSG
jgi:hypothetical protein